MQPRTVAIQDDNILLRMVREGDEEAFESLFHRYEGAIYRFCLLMLGDQDAAKDIHQETFFRLYHHSRTGGDVRSIYGWLMSAARSRCLNYLRDQKRQARLARDQAVERVVQPDFSTSIDLEHHLREALLNIPAHYREAILLFEVEGYSYKEIAELLEIDFHQVKNRIYQAKRALQELLTPILFESESR